MTDLECNSIREKLHAMSVSSAPEPARAAWESLVAYAYTDDRDGARVVQQITGHYLHMRAERDEAIATRNAAQFRSSEDAREKQGLRAELAAAHQEITRLKSLLWNCEQDRTRLWAHGGRL